MALYSVKGGWLFKDGKQVPFKESPNVGGALKAPSLLVMHYTAGTSAAGAISWLCDERAEASAHLVVDQTGAITQLVNFGRVAWHAGRSEWKKRIGCNSFSIGIELVNPGFLEKRADGKFYLPKGKSPIAAGQVILAAHKNGGGERPWMVYPAAQIDEAAMAAIAISRAYGLKEVVGHEDVAPGRKTDPGPAFPMASFVAKVLGRK